MNKFFGIIKNELSLKFGFVLTPHYIRNDENGKDKSSKKSNSLWSISFGKISEQGPAHISCNC